ncbi:MAG: hypothetical protein K8S87_10820 [Planctomycetes bacterium]|nr:hypothetical protein [Planctomycetota bacterium]
MTIGIMLIILGLLMIFAEVLIPSGGIISILAVGSFIGGFVFGFEEGVTQGLILVGGSVVLVPVVLALAFKIFPNTSLGKRMIAQGTDLPKEERQAVVQEEKSLIGQIGISKTQLRPAGAIDISGIVYDVVTEGNIIDPNTRVQVVEVSGNRIVVRSIIPEE